jgi:maleate isomerase
MGTAAVAGSAYGWRARIGFITPSPTVENNAYEFYLMVPSGVTILATSLGVLGLSQDQYDAGLSRLSVAVDEMVHRKVDVIVQAGVPLVVTHGWGYEEQLLAQIRAQTALPATTDIGASIAALQALGLSRVAMLSPFGEELQGQIINYVREAGIQVVAAASVMGTMDFDDIGSAPTSLAYRAARRLVAATTDPIDGLWITGAYLPTVGIIDALETDLQLPVVTAMQAMTWAGLQLAHVDVGVDGYGQLFTRRLTNPT